jgi:hypothetical protein
LRNFLAKNDFKLTYYPWGLFSPDSTPPYSCAFLALCRQPSDKFTVRPAGAGCTAGIAATRNLLRWPRS